MRSAAEFLSAEEAAARVPDGATVLVDGSGGGVNEPDAILAALERRWLDGDGPRDLTLVHPSGLGDGEGSGIERLAHAGLVRRVIGGHWAWSRRMQALAVGEEIEAYCMPQGVISHLLREIAGGRPGVVTSVGLHTFADPRLQGCRLNASAREDLVELVELSGREYLLYKAFPIDVAIVRATVVDARGNATMDGEGLYAETLSAAQAASNSGGVVLLQARERVDAAPLDPRRVRVPGAIVDAVVLEPNQRLSADTGEDPALTGAARAAMADAAPMPLTPRKVIARRAVRELREGDIVNLGFGMPDGVAAVLAEAGEADSVTFTVEQGHVGGVPAGGRDFGLARNQEAMVDAGLQFDWYDGGGLDVAVLSFAEIDRHGNVNVSRFGDRLAGVGGFVNIAQGSPRVVFVGTFSTGGANVEVAGERLTIHAEGATVKLVEEVEQISFSAVQALRNGQEVLYVTERAVFALTADGLRLLEVAPGVDAERDVLGLIPFPVEGEGVGEMEPVLFATVAGIRDARLEAVTARGE
jgi:propionate CoA-transferase